MEPERPNLKARAVATSILSNLQARSGFVLWWDAVDKDIQGEILDEMTDIANHWIGQ